MIEGLTGDDAWVMVEDEFLETAKIFTRHLHHAEYQRMKDAARLQNASKAHSISRPVDSRTTLSAGATKRIEAAKMSAAQEQAVEAVLDQDSSDEDIGARWIEDPRLAGLMTMPRTLKKISTVAGVKSNTRAAAGYSQAKALPERKPPRKDGSHVETRPAKSMDTVQIDRQPDGELRGLQTSLPRPKADIKRALGPVPPLKQASEELAKRPLQSPTKGFAKRLAERKAAAAKGEHGNGQPRKTLNDIPTFLV